MNKLNPLFEAVSNIDDNIASAAIKEKRRKPIALMIAAAALISTIALTSVMGAKSHDSLTADTPGVNVDYVHLFNFNLVDKKDLNILTKDELREIGAIERGSFEQGIYTFLLENALPSDILKMYNADPITFGNDNFTEEPSDVYVHGMMFDPDNFEFKDLRFSYKLIHKKTNTKLAIDYLYSIDDFQLVWSTGKIDDYEVIVLNDGSKAMVNSYGAIMSYNGAVIDVNSYHKEVGIDGMKQILADLGVLF